MSMNPRATTDKIRSDYENYVASMLSVKDKEITRLAHHSVRSAGFIKGPFLETTLPFVDGKTLQELVAEGLISNEFARMGKCIHFSDWKLRIHQEKALRHIIEKDRNMVISTGTGSGKTECYLYPIFNALMREKEASTLSPGVRALLIFPMNALANDQQKKLRKLLKDYPDITFGRYTGETAHKKGNETPEDAEARMHAEYNISHSADTDEASRKSIPNELMCREMMAKEPPHILLTNYAMLEYMLLRPDTAPFFDNDSAKNWHFIVIDEAHTYRGANGTEIAYLLRRLKERIRHHMKDSFRCIATSATLGSNDPEGIQGLADFAAALFGEEFSPEDIITTKRVDRVRPDHGKLYAPEDYSKLKTQASEMSEAERGAFLYENLKDDLRLFRVYSALKSKTKEIEEVADIVFDDIPDSIKREAALIDMIELAAAAKKSEYDAALLPARYHLFVKSLEGLFVQYYPQKAVYLDRKEKVYCGNDVYSVFELANCQKCKQEYLVGRTMETSNGTYFVQTNNSDRPEFYFVSNRSMNELEDLDEDDNLDENKRIGELQKFHLCLSCGRITPFSESHPLNCCNCNDAKKVVTVYRLGVAGKDNESNCCPCCGSTRKGLIKRFLTANQPATFAIAKSLYDAIPPRPVVSDNIAISTTDDLFADDLFDDPFADEIGKSDAQTPSEILDESGRKLLIFSDNRQEAAFFAGFFEKRYNLVMWRKVMLAVLSDAPDKALRLPDLIQRVMNEADKTGLYTFDLTNRSSLTDDQKLSLASLYVMQEFISPEIGTGLEGMGYIEFRPLKENLRNDITAAGLHGTDLWNLIRFMLDTLREKGATSFPEPIRATNDFLAPKNHTGYFRQYGTRIEHAGHVYGFIPDENAVNKRLGMVLKLIKDDSLDNAVNKANARAELITLFNLILGLRVRGYLIDVTNPSLGSVYQLNHTKWEAKLIEPKSKLYRCKKCGRVYGYSILGLCPELKCDGHLEEITRAQISDEPYYQILYSDRKLIPMVSREHTAQLSTRTAGEYQKDFEEGKINVLSCSTTFEMGVDVGELEATFLRNVPPETSNYIQRAGRAGRRTSSAAFSVTFSRRNSHDMTFFHNPAEIIAGKITPPILEVQNEKIAERHLNSVVVSWFFKRHPEFFNGKTQAIVNYPNDENMATVMRSELEKHPSDLLDALRSILPKDIFIQLDVENWRFIDDITGEGGSLTRAISERSIDVDGLKRFSDETRHNSPESESISQLKRAIAAERLVSTLESEPSISFLSAKGVLPKYGFPIDSVSLDILGGTNEEAQKIDLSRDLKMAISEFAPPAKIVANGKIWESYAINTIPNKGWPAYVYHECPKCKRIYHPEGHMVEATANLNEHSNRVCPHCQTLMNPRLFIIPKFGFSTQMEYKPKPVGEAKPSTYYSTRTQFWGIDGRTEKQKAEAMDGKLDFLGKSVYMTYSPGGKLFVLNQGTNGNGIRICPTCGFAIDPSSTVKKIKSHDNKYKRPCPNKNLITASLGHEFSTDILKIVLPDHPSQLTFPQGLPAKDQLVSILYALLEGASKALGISREDINGCISEDQELVLFDEAAGGAGFVKKVFQNFEKVLREARNKVSGQCGCGPETSCYGCLRNYSNQYFHDSISRGMALEYIDWLLSANVEAKPPVKASASPTVVHVDNEETLGTKKLEYPHNDTAAEPDLLSVIESQMNSSEDDILLDAYQRLKSAVGKGSTQYEKPLQYRKLPTPEKDLWPELFWPISKVAIFSEAQSNQYKILKKYDWYCYLLNQDMDAERVLSHIKKGEM